ncbi:hypothetical protein BJ508DRAFT_166080 [Ascobolus immersus RN42]|uniref:Uncharacterized protein n=1 Tax=Ascobolus immersus RN42 TaxID=1160509 RepID=A0A3N4IHL4_ASCIM|nr:hypothetical protein BJ508DRAFT_166080 [Ascobolus immersus RN42]
MVKRKAAEHRSPSPKPADKSSKPENPVEADDGNGSECSFDPSGSDNDNITEVGDDAGQDNLQQLFLTLQQNTQKRRTQALSAALNSYSKTLDNTTVALLGSITDKRTREEAEFQMKKDRITELMTRRKELVLELQAIKKDVEECVAQGSKDARMDGDKVIADFIKYDESVRKTWLGK